MSDSIITQSGSGNYTNGVPYTLINISGKGSVRGFLWITDAMNISTRCDLQSYTITVDGVAVASFGGSSYSIDFVNITYQNNVGMWLEFDFNTSFKIDWVPNVTSFYQWSVTTTLR